MGFLNELEASAVNSYLKNRGYRYSFYGGYPLAKRVFLSVMSDGKTDESTILYPFAAYKVDARKDAGLTHKDYLGALMGLGIKRECVGDIVVEENHAIVFLKNEIANFVMSELTEVGREGVKISAFKGETQELCDKFEELRLIVTSMRVDNVVSSCANISRQKALDFINSDKVFINYCVPSKVSSQVNYGDILSIRGFGKFKIVSQLSTTKRDRMVISVLHYI